MDKNKKINVLVVDDSALMRKVISDILNSSDKINVIDTASNGQIALSKIETLNPDVITLDVDMPTMDGFTCLNKIMETNPKPVIMLSGLTQEGALLTLRCLEVGAFDFVSKPLGGTSKDLQKLADEIIDKVITAYNNKHRVALKKLINKKETLKPIESYKTLTTNTTPQKKPIIAKNLQNINLIIGIGISTGGPIALREVIPNLPNEFPPILIVQHMPQSFTKAFADRLNSESQLNVKEAYDNEIIQPNTVYIAPGGFHMKVKKEYGQLKICITDDEPVSGHKPSVDVLFTSLANVMGKNVIAVIMTGMGRDGAAGIKLIKQTGGYTIAQDEESCIVFGMPKAAINEGAIEEIVPLSKISSKLINLVEKLEKNYNINS